MSFKKYPSILGAGLAALLLFNGCGSKEEMLPEELVKAAHEGDMKTLKAKVKDQKVALLKDKDGNTLVMHAVLGKQKKALEYLLAPDLGAEVIDACNNEGKTAFYLILEEGDADMAMHLVAENGADPAFSPKGKPSPLKLAEEKEMTDLAAFIKEFEGTEKGKPCEMKKKEE